MFGQHGVSRQRVGSGPGFVGDFLARAGFGEPIFFGKGGVEVGVGGLVVLRGGLVGTVLLPR